MLWTSTSHPHRPVRSLADALEQTVALHANDRSSSKRHITSHRGEFGSVLAMPRSHRQEDVPSNQPTFAALLQLSPPPLQQLLHDAFRGVRQIGNFCTERILKHRPPLFRLLLNERPLRRKCQKRHFRVRDVHFSSLSVGDFDLGDLKESLSRIQLPFWVDISSPGHPDKKRLMTVHDFFKYTEKQGKTFFESLDRDSDGVVTLDDMRHAMKTFKLPEKYAKDFLNHARGGRWWEKSITWDEFKALVDERESDMLRAFTTLTVNKKGQLDVEGLKNSLEKLGLPATEGNAKAMLKALGSEKDGYVSYSKFRNFAILLPKHTLIKSDPSLIWFESATMVPIGPPRTEGDALGTGKMMITAALAGGLASACSTFVMHPVDTLKTRVQSTVGASALAMMRSIPKIGVQNLYKGVVPATAGSGLSQSMRTFAYEGVFRFLSAVTGGGLEVQLQGLSIGVGTFIGAGVRIPCEVLKQRLQIGRHENAKQALDVALAADGPRGLYKGTLALLSREVPFYMFGMMFYQLLKKTFRGEFFGGGRELRTWEILTVGALSGALGAIATTPADVVKTRIMSAAPGTVVSPSQILIDMLKAEGIPALFKGCLPRAIWIAPVGVMNFAGYELAKKAIIEAEKKKTQFEQNVLNYDGSASASDAMPFDHEKGKMELESHRVEQLAEHAMVETTTSSFDGKSGSNENVRA